jgi:hypothetical protein
MENHRQKRYRVKKNKVNELTCFKCGEKIIAPLDFLGSIYSLLEVHYIEEHSINLKKVDWDSLKEEDIEDEDLW